MAQKLKGHVKLNCSMRKTPKSLISEGGIIPPKKREPPSWLKEFKLKVAN